MFRPFFNSVLVCIGLSFLSWSPVQAEESAYFAGGCFWCVEHLFDTIDGVISTTSGYMGGETENPTYKMVSSGKTGHTEAVKVVFDPSRVSYAELLKSFWINIDPTTKNRQFCDRGSQYRAGIFYQNDSQAALARISKKNLARTKPFVESIHTEILPAPVFYPAEPYHQDYHHKNPIRYRFYRYNCGRQQRLKTLWQGYDATRLLEGIKP
ncbi:peptide-methionine (S)-S-oxide reductase MsrA [Magnetococcales bacterium HHB-1]